MAAGRPDEEPRPASRSLPDDLQFRTGAAPGLDEDDIFIAMLAGAFSGVWGDGRAWPAAGPDERWSEDAERRRRHDRLLRSWDPIPPGTEE
ncbi:MAG: hypothetical protein RIB67_02640 [Miltoncostaeaceae bacterium]